MRMIKLVLGCGFMNLGAVTAYLPHHVLTVRRLLDFFTHMLLVIIVYTILSVVGHNTHIPDPSDWQR